MINEAASNEIRRLLVVMAHPDDAEFLVGGTLFHLKALGWQLGIVSMTAGDCGSATHSKEEITRVRLTEARAAADFLGARYECAGLMDFEVILSARSLRKVVESIRRFAPDVVITHSPVDYMVDHEETSRLARAATFGGGAPLYETGESQPADPVSAIPALYYADAIEGVGPLGERIRPDFYVDISAQLSKKREMLSRHSSQREWLRHYHGIDEYLDRMERWAESYGREAGFAYAEGLRQHLGHSYPRAPILQEALGSYVRPRE